MPYAKLYKQGKQRISPDFCLFFLCLFFVLTFQAWAQVESQLKHFQIRSNSLFNSPQNIQLLLIPNKGLSTMKLSIAADTSNLRYTADFAEKSNALAAVNGSFFNTETGSMVTYFEQDGEAISRAETAEETLLNAVFIISEAGLPLIEAKKEDVYYLNSREEKFVISSGPLLLKDSISVDLPQNPSFVQKRHPRTCLCIRNDGMLFIAVDGRTGQASGMTLPELQSFLLSLGCKDALNLDGGGSTTMWLRDKGIVNHPSDEEGARKVANAVLLLPKTDRQN